MATVSETRAPRLGAALRQEDRVMPLELFFDLVFVLAITQCTSLMSHNPTWEGLAQGILVLALLWWAWVSYSWLTSVLDPEEDLVRLAIFAAMGAVLIAALCVPEAFGDLALEFALAYGAVRAAHIGLFLLASRDDPALRRSVTGFAITTSVAGWMLIGGSFLDGAGQGAVWGLALLLDLAGPFFVGAAGWRLVPGHFAERHNLIIIVALGESIVAIGVGAGAGLGWGIAAAAALAIALACALWWVYFDVVSLVSARRLTRAPEGRERNELARDSYSYIHFPMVAGIVLFALGVESTLAHAEDPLETVPAFALLGGVALYLLGLVAFRYRHVHTINRHRLALALILVALVPAALELPALAILALLATVLWTMIVYETIGYGEGRVEVRHGDAAPPAH